MNTPAYLDHNASSPMHAAVIEAMSDVMGEMGNASSVHAFGRRHRRHVEDARLEVAALVGAQPDKVVFTGGGTEANNLALKATGRQTVIVSSIEHDSVLQAADDAQRVAVDRDGVVDLTDLQNALDAGGALISVMRANNETGVLQPVADIAEMANGAGGLLHTDAVQAAGRLPLDIGALGVSMLSLSAHKIGGPQGVGALVLGADVPFSAQIRGGGQERGRRAGTENAAGIVGFGVAARLARERLACMTGVGALRDRLEARLRREMADAVVFGERVARLPNTSCFAVPGLSSETLVMGLDLAGLAVSAGSACSSGKVTPSHVLQAMGVPETLAACAIRVSLGTENSESEIDRLVTALVALRERRSASAA